MTRWLASAALGLGISLVGCGGGGGGGQAFKDPASVTFHYAPAYTPSPGSAEANAAAAGQSGVAGSSAIRTQGYGDDQAAGSVIGLPNSLAEEAFGWSGGFSRSAEGARALVARRAAAYLAGDVAAVASDWDDPGCWSVTAAAVTFGNCTLTHIDGTAREVLTVDGALQRAGDHVWWAVTVRIDASDSSLPASMAVSDRASGDLTFGAGTVDGFEQSDIYVHESVQGQSATAAVTYRADLGALAFTADPGVCATGVTGGTLTLKRVWTTRPSGTGMDPELLTDRALRFTWLDCGLVQVEVGTP
jgi:hypothetical protein